LENFAMHVHFGHVLRPAFAAAAIVCFSGSAFAQAPPAQPTAPQAPAGSVQGLDDTRQGPVRPLSVDEAVALALEQNLNIQVERLNPQIQDLGVAQARTAWTPLFSTGVLANSRNTPSSGALSGAQGPSVVDDTWSTSIGVQQQLPWGGWYTTSWDSQRVTTNNIFTNFDPILRSNLSLSYTQPLLRNFSIDAARQQLQISRKNREISDVQFRQQVASTMRNVKHAYWDLAYAYTALDVQRQSLDLAQESLRNNRVRVEVGTMAPIDIVEAEAEVARNEESVIVAEAAIRQAEDRLRSLIFDPQTPDFWNITLEPTDSVLLQARDIDVNAAILNALENRTDIRQARKTMESSDINIRYFRNQTLPDVNLQVNYGLTGLGGTQLVRDGTVPGFPQPVIDRTQRSFGSVLGDIFRNDFPTWTVSLNVGYPIGTSSSDAGLARARLQYSQSHLQIRNLELQVTTQVREVARQVSTNLKRVEATRATRELSERRLEAEQKKFGVGTSTSFLVFQAQRDLALARNNELRAILDYNRSLVDFEAVQEIAITGTAGVIGVQAIGGAGTPTGGTGVQGGGGTFDPSGLQTVGGNRPF
jgi:outer membrane protein